MLGVKENNKRSALGLLLLLLQNAKITHKTPRMALEITTGIKPRGGAVLPAAAEAPGFRWLQLAARAPARAPQQLGLLLSTQPLRRPSASCGCSCSSTSGSQSPSQGKYEHRWAPRPNSNHPKEVKTKRKGRDLPPNPPKCTSGGSP